MRGWSALKVFVDPHDLKKIHDVFGDICFKQVRTRLERACWQRCARRLVMPLDFITAAELNDQILYAGKYARRDTSAQLGELKPR